MASTTNAVAKTSAKTTNATPVAKTTTPKRVAKPKVETKTCRVCAVAKTLDEYRAKASRPDGRDSICAACARLWLANRKVQLAALAKTTTKPAAKTSAKTTTKPAAKPAAKPVAKTTTKTSAKSAA
jgi:hypothetical protein